MMVGDCNRDPKAVFCKCDPPCDAVCIVPGCDLAAVLAVPCELVFGSRDGKLLKTDWGTDTEISEWLIAGGWDVWVCEEHGV
jgi:hypothetical protein